MPQSTQTPSKEKIFLTIKHSFTYKDFFNILWFPAAVYLLNDITCTFFLSWYEAWSVDSFFHFLGGISIAYGANYVFNFLEKNNQISIKNVWLKIFIIATTVALVATLWEVYEYVRDIIFATVSQPSVFDTVKDEVVGIFGGFIFAYFANFIWTSN